MARKPQKWPKMDRGDGTWSYDEVRKKIVLRFMIDGKRVSTLGESTTECMAKRDERRRVAREAAEARTRLAHADATVLEMLEGWFAFAAGDRAPATRDGWRHAITVISKTQLGEMMARDVTFGDVERMYVELVADGRYGQGSLEKIRSHLSMAFDHGVRHGYATINPTRGTKLPGNVRRSVKPTWLDAEQFAAMRLYLAGKDSPYSRALLLTMLTGMRPGEALAVQWDAVDLEAGTIEVRRGLQRSMGGRVTKVVDTLKTTSSQRMLSLPPDAVEMLRQVRRERPFGLVFARPDGSPLRFDVLRLTCMRACHAIGAPMVSPNKLRHTNASMLLHLGQPLPIVAQHLGHDDLRMVMKTYGHAMQSQIDLGAVLGGGVQAAE